MTDNLNQSLVNLGELMAANLTEKGVDADANDGLTTLANKILDIPTGSSYHIELSEHTITTTGTFNISATLQEDYRLRAGAVIVFSGGDEIVTATTDEYGVATATVTFTTSGVLVATYRNVSDAAEVTVQSYIFYDDCTADNTSQYSEVVRFGSSAAKCTVSFASASNGYNWNGSGGDYFAGKVIPNIRGYDNIKISCKFYLRSSTAYNQVFIGCADNIISGTSSTFTADFFRVRADKQFDYIHNGGNEVWKKTNVMTFQNNWAKLEVIKQGTSLTGNIYNSNDSLLATSTQTANTYTNPYFFIGVNCKNSSDMKYIKDILVERV